MKGSGWGHLILIIFGVYIAVYLFLFALIFAIRSKAGKIFLTILNIIPSIVILIFPLVPLLIFPIINIGITWNKATYDNVLFKLAAKGNTKELKDLLTKNVNNKLQNTTEISSKSEYKTNENPIKKIGKEISKILLNSVFLIFCNIIFFLSLIIFLNGDDTAVFFVRVCGFIISITTFIFPFFPERLKHDVLVMFSFVVFLTCTTLLYFFHFPLSILSLIGLMISIIMLITVPSSMQDNIYTYDNKIDINQINNSNKWTPLFYAVDNNKKEMAEFLLSQGANVNILDENEKAPLDYAYTDEIKQFLIFHGAKSGKELKKLK